MTAINIESIIIIVITVKNLDSIDMQTVTSQIVLHPATTVFKGNVLNSNVLTLDKANEMGARDTLVIPR